MNEYVNKITLMQKSEEKSAKYRTAGNSMFSRSRLREAIRLYTEAIQWASPGSQADREAWILY